MKKASKVILLIIIQFSNSNLKSFSQSAPGIEWQKCYGGTLGEYCNSINITNDGGFIISGQTSSNDGDITFNHGGWDYWILKTDSIGNLQWQKCLGGTFADLEISSCVSLDGGYAIAGWSASLDGDVTGNHGDSDYWIVKLDTLGNIQWQKCYGGTSYDEAASIQSTSDYGYIVSGRTLSNDGDVSGLHFKFDIWVIKIDSIGNLQWQICLGGSEYEWAHYAGQNNDGTYFILGSTYSNDGDVSGNHDTVGNYRDYWVAKTDSIGTILWQKCYGGSYNDYARSIKPTTDGGYIVSGFTESNDGDVSGNNGAVDFWVIKIDSVGNLQWQKCLGGSSTECSLSVQQTTDNGFIVAGEAASNNGNVSGNHGPYDYWIVKLDSIGNIQWQKCLGGTSSEFASSLRQTDDKGYIIAGSAMSNDNDVSGNHGNWDFWVVKLAPDTITGITNLQITNSNFQINPNPFDSQSKLTFNNPNKDIFLFTLYDFTGKIAETVSTTNNEIILSKGSKQAGVYLINLVNEKIGDRWCGKVVITD